MKKLDFGRHYINQLTKKMKQVTTIKLSVAILIIAFGNCSGEIYAQQNLTEDRGDQVKQYVQPFLISPEFAKIDWKGFGEWKSDKYGKVRLPDEILEHRQGIFKIYNLSATVYATKPVVESGTYSRSLIRVLSPELLPVEEDAAKGYAVAFLAKAYPWFFAQKAILKIAPPSADGLWRFEWVEQDKNELPVSTAHAKVRAIDGTITQFSAVRVVGPWPPHKVLPSQAGKIALQVMAEDIKNTHPKSISIVDNILTLSTADLPIYEIKVEAIKNSGEKLTGAVTIDAMTGKQLPGTIHWFAHSKGVKEMSGIQDKQPIWTNTGLIFISTRPIKGLPFWGQLPPQVFLQNQANELHHLTSDWVNTPELLKGIASGFWITVERKDWTYAFSLQNGDYRVLGHPDRPAQTPAVMNSGKWAVVSGTGRSGNPDLDLMPDNLVRAPQLSTRGRLVLPVGDEHHLMFSPDDKWLYFVTSKQDKTKTVHSLRRIASDAVLTKELKQLDEKQIDTVIAELPGDVERISIFPNGAKLLLQTDKGIYVVEIAAQKISAVTLKNLKDTELGSVAVEGIQDGWAGPTDDRVTFSGKTTDKDGKVRRRIYSCRFDGGDLKAHTPKDNAPVPMYKFPGSNKTAYDLAKEWALNEIKFDDERKANR